MRKMSEMKYLKYAGIGMLSLSLYAQQGVPPEISYLETQVNYAIKELNSVLCQESKLAEIIEKCNAARKELEKNGNNEKAGEQVFYSWMNLDRILQDYKIRPDFQKPPKHVAERAKEYVKELEKWSYIQTVYVPEESKRRFFRRVTIPEHYEIFRIYGGYNHRELIETKPIKLAPAVDGKKNE